MGTWEELRAKLFTSEEIAEIDLEVQELLKETEESSTSTLGDRMQPTGEWRILTPEESENYSLCRPIHTKIHRLSRIIRMINTGRLKAAQEALDKF